MKKDTIIAIVLGVLILVSALQAVQLSALKTSLKEGVTVGSATTSVPAAGGNPPASGAKLPSSLENLPQMVGGC